MAGDKSRKKRKKTANNDVSLMNGLSLKEKKMDKRQILLNCILRSLMVFCVVFGSVGGFLSAFGISFHYVMVAVVYLVISFYASFLYTAPKLLYRDLGYLVFFGLFIGAIYVFKIYANSGLYEIINTVLEYAETFFDLPGTLNYEVQIDNPYLTVTILAMFLGMMEILVLNIWIYVTMGIGWTVFVTFPVLIIPMYMKLSPDVFYIILMAVGYLAVLVFKANGHYVTYVGEGALRVNHGKKKKKISYTQDLGTFRHVMISIALLVTMLGILLGGVVSPAAYERNFKSDKLRDETAELVGNFMMLGFSGIFNWYENTGGISGGKLGGISRVRPDNQPDLIVSFTPYSNEAIYLKAFTGGAYGDNEWHDLYSDKEPAFSSGENVTFDEYQESLEKKREQEIPIFEMESMKLEAERLKTAYENKEEFSAQGQMAILNVGADVHYLYYPYYTLFRDYSLYGSDYALPPNIWTFHTYYPQLNWEAYGKHTPAEIDTSKVDPVFLEVPEKNRKVIKQECEAMGLRTDMSENEIAACIRDYFDAEIPYTLKPGATPRGEDFINYFLKKNRKGFCAHFASAATLMFRYMGIPARYVEGYAFTMETALISDENMEISYEEYYSGYSEIGKSTVLDVEVTDAMAHAWVEIYVEGFGWKPVEVTPGSAQATDEDDFWSAFTRSLSERMNNLGGGDGGNLFRGISLSGVWWLLYIVIGVILLAATLVISRIIIRKTRRFVMCHQKDKQEAMIARYCNVCDMERTADERFHICRSHIEQLTFFQKKYQLQLDCQMVSAVLEKASFSSKDIEAEKIKMVVENIHSIRHAIIKKAGIALKIRLLLR